MFVLTAYCVICKDFEPAIIFFYTHMYHPNTFQSKFLKHGKIWGCTLYLFLYISGYDYCIQILFLCGKDQYLWMFYKSQKQYFVAVCAQWQVSSSDHLLIWSFFSIANLWTLPHWNAQQKFCVKNIQLILSVINALEDQVSRYTMISNADYSIEGQETPKCLTIC